MPDAAQTLRFDCFKTNNLFTRTFGTPGSSKVEYVCFWFFVEDICYHQSCWQTQMILYKPDFTPVTPLYEFAMKEKIILDHIRLTLQNELVRGSVIELEDVVSWFKVSRILLPKVPSLTVCCYHVTYAFQCESTFYSCLNVNELLARNRRNI